MTGQGVKPNGKHAGRGRTGISMNVIVYRTYMLKNKDNPYLPVEVVDWTCPKCGHRNVRIRWYGREKHICRECEEWTDVKGTTIDAHSINADIETL